MNYRGDRNIFMDFKGVPLKGKNGEIEGLLCIIEETTDRVKTRAKIMQEAKMSAIGKLAAGIAHELNNPLGTLVAYSELAGTCLKSFQKPSKKQFELKKLKGYLEIIEEEAFRCKHVTTDILSLFQKEGLEITEIDINELLNTIVELINTDRSNVMIINEVISPLPLIMGDINALRQVFVNLINNALDATERRVDATIWIRTKLDGNRALVEIEDNGTGIPDSIIDKIFEPFFTTKEPKRGTGLGLSLCYDFIGYMGGTIKAKSKPGYRTTFAVAFPVQKKRT
jgi:two-component system NtrC family sensor kinase